MARRYCGDVVVNIRYVGTSSDGLETYAGTVSTVRDGRRYSWAFDGLMSGVGYAHASDSSEAYDRMAESALSFATYYTTHNRGDVGEGFPTADVADALESAAYDYGDDGHAVRRRK